MVKSSLINRVISKISCHIIRSRVVSVGHDPENPRIAAETRKEKERKGMAYDRLPRPGKEINTRQVCYIKVEQGGWRARAGVVTQRRWRGKF